MRYSVAVDLGGTNLAIGIVSEEAELFYKTSVPIADSNNVEVLASQMAEGIKGAIADSGIEPSSLAFVGIGIPGISRTQKGPVIFAPNIHWREVDIARFLGKEIDLPIYLGNDADCALLGEYVAGIGKNYHRSLMLTLGTGVGGSILIDGKPMDFGPHGGEFGHIPLVHGGVLCGCGKKGCFEAYCSAVALKRETRDAAAAHPESLIWELCEGDLQKVGGRTPFDTAEAGDETAIAVVSQYIRYLADGISGLINIFRPDVVFLGGGVSNQGDSLLIPLDEEVQKLCYSSFSVEPPHVIRASLGNKAGIIGAGLLGF